MAGMAAAISLHLLAAVVWVGGMLVMLWVVRPTAVALLESPLRLHFLCSVLERFFRWVWLAIGVILASGYWMLFAVFGGMASVGMHVHLMQLLGLLMMVIFVFLYCFPFRRLKRALAEGQAGQAPLCLAHIRRLVTLNALLGLSVVLIGAGGRYL